MALLATVVRRALKSVKDPNPVDLAAAELAVSYAKAIDEDPDLLGKTGPLLLTTLDALLMTPRSRAAVHKGVKDAGQRSNPLDELRARRAARVGNPPAVDSSTP